MLINKFIISCLFTYIKLFVLLFLYNLNINNTNIDCIEIYLLKFITIIFSAIFDNYVKQPVFITEAVMEKSVVETTRIFSPPFRWKSMNLIKGH